jgi:hypothetical protein
MISSHLRDRSRLGPKLLAVVVLKVLFLCVLWQFVLKPQVTHVDASAVQQKLFSSQMKPEE